MKTYIQNMSKKGLAISSLVVGFLIGVLVIGAVTADMRDGRGGYGYGKHKMGSDMGMQKNKMAGMNHEGMMMQENQMNMDEMMKGMMVGLQGKTGLEFDQAFLKEMIVHHQGAVAMAEQVLAASKRPELLKLANDIIKAQQNEIDMMKKWQIEWVK